MVDYSPRSRAWFFRDLRVLRGILQPLICTGLSKVSIAASMKMRLTRNNNGDNLNSFVRYFVNCVKKQPEKTGRF